MDSWKSEIELNTTLAAKKLYFIFVSAQQNAWEFRTTHNNFFHIDNFWRHCLIIFFSSRVTKGNNSDSVKCLPLVTFCPFLPLSLSLGLSTVPFKSPRLSAHIQGTGIDFLAQQSFQSFSQQREGNWNLRLYLNTHKPQSCVACV